MTHEIALDSKIDSYLARVRAALGSLAQPEIEDIIRELRSHAVECPLVDSPLPPAK